MCLEANAKTKRDFKRRNKHEEWVTGYKVYLLKSCSQTELSCLHAPILAGEVTTIKKHGWIVSNREGNTNVGSDCNDYYDDYDSCFIVNRGIHVYLDYSYAETRIYEGFVIVPVQCKVDDLVGLDKYENHAVFMKVYLRKEDFRRIKKD